MIAATVHRISDYLKTPVKRVSRLSGGDIADAYCLETPTQRFFCKALHGSEAFRMLAAESDALNEISQTKTIKTPQVYGLLSIDDSSFLILDFIEQGNASSNAMNFFGAQLASLHQVSQLQFGWEKNNFIGLLPQSNNTHDSWSSFYAQERLLPQMRLAKERGLLASSAIPETEKLIGLLESFMKSVEPSLLHGDLWSGNYLMGIDSSAYLIDPAMYYGHSEVDLAMTRLFGGFGPAFYNGYHEVLPKKTGMEERIALYQLYYLLVHLNLFGSSYHSSVSAIIKRFF